MNKVAGRMTKEQALAQSRLKAEEIVCVHVGTLPTVGSLPQSLVNEVLHFHEFLKEAECGRLRMVTISCAHCGKGDTKFSSVSSKDTVSTYCSSICRQSKLNHMPAGWYAELLVKPPMPVGKKRKKLLWSQMLASFSKVTHKAFSPTNAPVVDGTTVMQNPLNVLNGQMPLVQPSRLLPRKSSTVSTASPNGSEPDPECSCFTRPFEDEKVFIECV